VSHHHTHANNERRLFWAFFLTTGIMVIEVLGGIVSGSLALLADAGHMLTDSVSLALSWLAFRIARKPSDTQRTFGYQRAQVLAAFVNGVSLILLVGWIVKETIERLLQPTEVLGDIMFVVALLGLVVNIIAFVLLHGGSKDNLNIHGALLHVLGDLLGSVAAIVAALIIMWTGWMPIDPLLSVLVALLIFKSAWGLVKKSVHVLLEGVPDWLDIDDFKKELKKKVPLVQGVHHVHAWCLTSEHPLMTLHIDVCKGTDHEKVLKSVKSFINKQFGIDHTTIQIENGACIDGEMKC
jgi:cobalt-zinc-cadmium efflux system protein